MKPARFDYIAVDSAEEAALLLAQHGEDARVLAGGQSLMAVLNMRLAQPKVIVDISRSREMNYVKVDRGELRVGAAATQASVEWRKNLADEVPLLALAFPHLGHFQTRNRGTVCGSIAHADPSAELPLVLAALGGSVVLRAPRLQRVVPAAEFFQGMLLTARQANEVVEEVRFPLAEAGARYAFREVAMRHGDFALVALAAVIRKDGARLAVGGVADRPVVANFSNKDSLDEALNDFAWTLEAQDDHHASASYRRHLVRALGKELLS
jgi:2-furoyl-CoA dehydrogenase FAD binding subunit